MSSDFGDNAYRSHLKYFRRDILKLQLMYARRASPLMLLPTFCNPFLTGISMKPGTRNITKLYMLFMLGTSSCTKTGGYALGLFEIDWLRLSEQPLEKPQSSSSGSSKCSVQFGRQNPGQ